MQPLPVCSRDRIHTPARLCIKTVTATRPPSFCRVNAFVRLSGSGIEKDSWLATDLDLYETKWLAGCGGAEAEDGRRNVFRVALQYCSMSRSYMSDRQHLVKELSR